MKSSALISNIRKSLGKSPLIPVFSLSLILALLFSAFGFSPALAGCADGNSADNDLVCDSDTGIFNTWEGNGGDDTMTQTEDSDIAWDVSGGRGDDEITINGTVGENLLGISVNGDGLLIGNGGDDTITINGSVDGDVNGDGIVFGDGGNDTIIINGSVGGDVNGDGIVFGEGGDDTVIVGENASIAGTIDGGGGTDTLIFKKIYKDVLDKLDPAGDSVGGYTWVNFEFLIGKLREIAAAAVESGKRILFNSGTLLAVDNGQGDGFKVFGEPGTIAFVPYASLNSLTEGQSQTFQAPNSQGWYVVVVNLGVDPNNSAHNLYQVGIYNSGGSLQGQFTVSE